MKPARALPVLMYHHVSYAPGLVTVSPECFRAQMTFLARRGWRTVGCDDLAAFLGGAPMAEKSFLITFDDGYLDNYVHAYPVLRDLGMKATLFLVTGWIGNGPRRFAAGDDAVLPTCRDHRACKAAIREGHADEAIIRWSEAERMASEGTFAFHSHTHTHRRWDQELIDPAARHDALAADLEQSRRTLNERLSRETTHLCWPQGYYHDDYLPIALAAGFSHCHTTERRTNQPGGDPQRIGRIAAKEANPEWLERRLKIYASPWLAEIYGLIRT